MQPIIILGTVFYIKGIEEYYLENASFNEAFFGLIKMQFATLLQPAMLPYCHNDSRLWPGEQ